MPIVGLKTKMVLNLNGSTTTGGSLDISTTGIAPVILEGTNIQISTSVIEVVTPIEEPITTVIVITTTDDTPLIPVTVTILKPGTIPITATELNNSIGSSIPLSTSYIELTYIPTNVESTTVIVRLDFGNGITFDIPVNLTSTVTAANFTIDPEAISFGDIGSLDASIRCFRVSSTLTGFDSRHITFGITASDDTDALNFSVDLSSGEGTPTEGYGYSIIFNPLFSKASTATLTIFYSSHVIGSIDLSGSKNDLNPWILTFNDPTLSDNPELTNMGLLASYTNNTLKCFRVSGVNITGDILTEFSITNLAFLIDSVVLPKAIIRVALNYTPKQGTFNFPNIELQGEYF